MSLYHKHRPDTLEQIKGNAETISALQKMLNKPKTMPHAYLLSGETGCGKTTIGRIIKTVLEVEDCDFNEINSSDFRGIDTIRDIIKNSQYKPLNSKYRIYLLDEVHQLSSDAQNALLKILEDTPKHVIFILCTTNPEKLLAAIKNRCQHFTLKPLNETEMKGLLKRVARAEGERLETEVMAKIINNSNGLPRNALQILERVLATDPEQRLEAAVQAEEEKNESIELCRALLSNSSWGKVKGILNGLIGQNAESIRRHVLGYCQAVLLKKDNEKCGLIMEEFIEPFYNSGFPQLVLACYTVVKN